MAAQNYSGSCQCQAVKFDATLDLANTMTCNCSRCQRLGWVMAFTPRDKFRFQADEGATSEYLFNKERIRHQFCKTCGIEPFAFSLHKGVEMAAVNVNCLDGVDPRALPSKHVDGRSL
jgi:hypothetical protein